tara:strand:- start:4564 stop:5016 length:453 start_codon:yes stop_codon:yes gene_type:complete
MPAFAAAGAAFLLAVLWFDLMFDVQVRPQKTGTLPPATLASISAYYRRVTTDARPMNMLVSAAMLATLVAVIAELMNNRMPLLAAALSLVLVVSAIGLAGSRTVPNAKRLGSAADTPDEQSRLARQIYSDHRYCFAAMSIVLALQLFNAA